MTSSLNLNKKLEFEIRLEKTEDRIKPQELSNFLYYYKILYSGIKKEGFLLQEFTDRYSNGSIEEIIVDIQKHREDHLKIISRGMEIKSPNELNSLFWEEEQGYQLEMTRIQKGSPLTISLVGLGFAIVIVTAVCGGEGNIAVDSPFMTGEASFRLDKTLGEGIQDIKDAFDEEN